MQELASRPIVEVEPVAEEVIDQQVAAEPTEPETAAVESEPTDICVATKASYISMISDMKATIDNS